MFDHPNDPQHLIDSLLAFVDSWQGIRPWYGIASEKLSAVSLPKPLSQLHGALGNMPGTDGRPFPFWAQDRLLPFELLRQEDSRLLFAVENQGCWQAFTELAGDDPRVWIHTGEDQPEQEHPSLANFVVTLCLQELTFSCPVLYTGQNLREAFERMGHRVNPLWLEGLLPGFDGLVESDFFLVDGCALIFRDEWIGFQALEEADRYSDALAGAERTSPPETLPMSEYLTRPGRNPMIERIYYDRLARDYQEQADAMLAKAEECRRAANHAVGLSGGADSF